MNGAPTESPHPEVTHPYPEGHGWGWRKMLLFILIACAAHAALIFVLGAKKMPVSHMVHAGVPHLALAGAKNELAELENPALLALPNPHDFAAAVWLQPQVVTPPVFHWTETPRWLPLSGKDLGLIFNRYMQTNAFVVSPLTFKATPQFKFPAADPNTGLPTNSVLLISPTLAKRELLYQPALPSLPFNDAVAPTRVRVLVDDGGNVVSVTPVTSENSLETSGHWADADNKALVLARTLRFKPARQESLGDVVFYWHTIPLASTNAP